MAKKQTMTLTAKEGQEHLKPYCEAAQVAAEKKANAEALRGQASEELQKRLDSNPETKGFKGTVVCIFDDRMYKIRVQRPDKTDWLSKRLNDPNLRAYKKLMKKISEMEKDADDLVQKLEEAHPKCIELGFVIGFLSK